MSIPPLRGGGYIPSASSSSSTSSSSPSPAICSRVLCQKEAILVKKPFFCATHQGTLDRFCAHYKEISEKAKTILQRSEGRELSLEDSAIVRNLLQQETDARKLAGSLIKKEDAGHLGAVVYLKNLIELLPHREKANQLPESSELQKRTTLELLSLFKIVVDQFQHAGSSTLKLNNISANLNEIENALSLKLQNGSENLITHLKVSKELKSILEKLTPLEKIKEVPQLQSRFRIKMEENVKEISGMTYETLPSFNEIKTMGIEKLAKVKDDIKLEMEKIRKVSIDERNPQKAELLIEYCLILFGKTRERATALSSVPSAAPKTLTPSTSSTPPSPFLFKAPASSSSSSTKPAPRLAPSSTTSSLPPLSSTTASSSLPPRPLSKPPAKASPSTPSPLPTPRASSFSSTLPMETLKSSKGKKGETFTCNSTKTA